MVIDNYISSHNTDVIKEQNKELRGTQRQITRDRTALEKQEKQLVRIPTHQCDVNMMPNVSLSHHWGVWDYEITSLMSSYVNRLLWLTARDSVWSLDKAWMCYCDGVPFRSCWWKLLYFSYSRHPSYHSYTHTSVNITINFTMLKYPGNCTLKSGRWGCHQVCKILGQCFRYYGLTYWWRYILQRHISLRDLFLIS